MTIRFAAARPATIARRFGHTAGLRRRAANDNAAPASHDTLLRDALKHFAAHGLGAAAQARLEAERGWHAGRAEEYRHWLEICRRFDRRMAAALEARLGDRSGSYTG
jgi:hypothetical protein